MSIVIRLPWFDGRLNPNARVPWRAKAPVVAEARATAYFETLQQVAGKSLRVDAVPVLLTFCPPDHRGRDMDNCHASIKAFLDGIAQALDINDRAFHPVTLDWGEPVKGGAVIVEIGP